MGVKRVKTDYNEDYVLSRIPNKFPDNVFLYGYYFCDDVNRCSLKVVSSIGISDMEFRETSEALMRSWVSPSSCNAILRSVDAYLRGTPLPTLAKIFKTTPEQILTITKKMSVRLFKYYLGRLDKNGFYRKEGVSMQKIPTSKLTVESHIDCLYFLCKLPFLESAYRKMRRLGSPYDTIGGIYDNQLDLLSKFKQGDTVFEQLINTFNAIGLPLAQLDYQIKLRECKDIVSLESLSNTEFPEEEIEERISKLCLTEPISEVRLESLGLNGRTVGMLQKYRMYRFKDLLEVKDVLHLHEGIGEKTLYDIQLSLLAVNRITGVSY